MAAKRKCFICGEELHSISKRGLEYSVVLQNAKGSYHLCGRMKWNDKWSMLLSEQEDNPRIYSRPHPLCPACFLKKLRRAVVALETALECQDVAALEEDDQKQEQEQEQDEQPKKQDIDVPSAEEIRKKYPEFVQKVIVGNNGKPPSDDLLQTVFKQMHRAGYV